MEDTLMIPPLPRGRISRTARCASSVTAAQFTWRSSRCRSRSTSSKRPWAPKPALLTSRSMGPVARAASQRRLAAPRSVRSAGAMWTTVSDLARSRSASSASRSSRRAESKSSIPRAASCSAKIAPRPDDAPVISARRPSNRRSLTRCGRTGPGRRKARVPPPPRAPLPRPEVPAHTARSAESGAGGPPLPPHCARQRRSSTPGRAC